MLDEHGNIPYQAYEGFSRSFYESESPLALHTDRCMCISVIKGTTNPEQRFFTAGGSFFINATTNFLSRRLVTVQEEEQHRIAMELHDQTGQDLNVLKIRMAAFRNRLEKASMY